MLYAINPSVWQVWSTLQGKLPQLLHGVTNPLEQCIPVNRVGGRGQQVVGTGEGGGGEKGRKNVTVIN